MTTTAKSNVVESHGAEPRDGLSSWWSKFKARPTRKESHAAPNAASRAIVQNPVVDGPGIFSVPLHESLAYANVAISLYNNEGKSSIYGFIPIVVAKCGLFLKDNATETEGIFRLSGSAKRIKDLQVIFDEPPKYGKGLDWTGFTVHDAANILRRYLNLLPDPIIPYDWYTAFRQPLKENWPKEKSIPKMQELVASLPAYNRQLLLYILDLLAVFASKAEINRMTSENLSAIFQPGLITHPDHDMIPHEYKLSQEVLVFLIDNQSHFLLDSMCEPTTERVPSPSNSKKSGLMRRRTLQVARRSSANQQNSSSNMLADSPSLSSTNDSSSTIHTPHVNSKASSLSRSNTVPNKKRIPPPSSSNSQDRVPRHASTPNVKNGGVDRVFSPGFVSHKATGANEFQASLAELKGTGSGPPSGDVSTVEATPSLAHATLTTTPQKNTSPMSSRHNLVLKTDPTGRLSHRSTSTSAPNDATSDGPRSRRTSRGSSSIVNDAEFSILGGRKESVATPSGGSTSAATIPSTASTGDKSHSRQRESKSSNASPSKFSNLFRKKPRHQSVSSTSEAGGRRDLDK